MDDGRVVDPRKRNTPRVVLVVVVDSDRQRLVPPTPLRQLPWVLLLLLLLMLLLLLLAGPVCAGVCRPASEQECAGVGP